jgi:hypothetical protein
MVNGLAKASRRASCEALPEAGGRRNYSLVSTIAEIETAIAALPASEREALETRWLARRFGLDSLSEDERAELVASLDEAEREIDGGRGVSADDLRTSVRSWVSI